MVLLSYDVSAAHRSAASRVAHLIFGRKDAPERGPVPYIRRAGVVWIGQSVFLMPKPVATELMEKLHGLGAAVAIAHVSVLAPEVEALRRRPVREAARKHVYRRCDESPSLVRRPLEGI